jgi:methylated-DNA-[protein]-cysteine S-methyltransferase
MAGVPGNQLKQITVPTSLGRFVVAYTPRGVSGLEFPSSGRSRAAGSIPPTPPFLRRLVSQLQAYARGESVKFNIPLDLTSGTTFQQKVWRILQTIPSGETRSYSWLAAKIGHPKAARAVGAACGANPIPLIIPCHRVIASDGSLGGFSGGLGWKKALLTLEQKSQVGR